MVRKVEVWQTDEEQLHGVVAFHPADVHYASLPHDTLTTVWTPASGNRINLVSMVLSAQNAGVMEVRHGASTFIHIEFSERKAVPVGMATTVRFAVDEPIRAIFTGDTGTPSGYISLFGYED